MGGVWREHRGNKMIRIFLVLAVVTKVGKKHWVWIWWRVFEDLIEPFVKQEHVRCQFDFGGDVELEGGEVDFGRQVTLGVGEEVDKGGLGLGGGGVEDLEGIECWDKL